VSPEGLLVIAVATGFLAYRWVSRGGANLRAIVFYCLGLSTVVMGAVAAERPPAEWLTVDYARISIVHVTIALTMTVAAISLRALDRARLVTSVTGRSLCGVNVAAAVAIGLMLLFPLVLRSPFLVIDSGQAEHFLGQISELQSPVPQSLSSVPVALFIFNLGPPITALAFVLGALVRGRIDDRPRHILYLITLLVFIPYALLFARGLLLVAFAGLLPWSEMLPSMWRRAQVSWRNRRYQMAGAVGLAIVAACSASWLGGFAVAVAFDFKLNLRISPNCRYSEIAGYIDRLPEDSTARLIVTHRNSGPEVAYRTNYAVLTANYINPAGFEDANTIYYGKPGDPAVENIAARRDIRFFLFCKNIRSSERQFLSDQRDILVSRLFLGEPPPWLTRVELPPPLDRNFLLYRRVP
jgi:hypothetical protein